MTRRIARASIGLLTLSTLLIGACDGFSFTFSFILPRSATATETTTYTLPDGANIVVTNDNGSTRVTVDPAVTQATVEVRRTALVREQADADALLPKIVVTVTEPTMDANTLTISAPRPPEATDDSENFEVVVDDDEISVTTITEEAMVSVVNLRITVPPGHAVDVTHGNGSVRAVTLDTPSVLRIETGSIRSIGAGTHLTTRTGTGSVFIEGHDGGLDTMIGTGPLNADFADLDASEEVLVRIEVGSIELRLPDDVDADLSALTEVGDIYFSKFDFDDTNNLSQSHNGPGEFLTVTLNDGGASIDLRTETGGIDISD